MATGDIEEATITFTKSKKTVTWTSKKFIPLLKLAEEAGLKPDYGCRSGACGMFLCAPSNQPLNAPSRNLPTLLPKLTLMLLPQLSTSARRCLVLIKSQERARRSY